MINFRFHLVSLVAVFLALAVGIVMGYGVLGQPTIEGLQNRIDTVEAKANEQRSENETLVRELEQANGAIDESAPFAVTDRLTSTNMVVVAIREVDTEAVEQAVRLARTAGADVRGIVWLEPRFALSTRDDALALVTLLRLPSNTKAADLRDAAWRVLAARLAAGPAVSSEDETEDPLSALVAAGFVSLDGVDE
ncbi:MAG TPA: copper transporter, partial [Acidimicrobiia bacterium]|nr:copper transporter [Acidimicrobiia bacterium]